MCCRLFVCSSGRVGGSFEHEKLIIILEPNGGSFSYCFGDGIIFKELTRFATKKVRDQVRKVVDFRNRVIEVPYVCDTLYEHDVELDHRIDFIRWPTSRLGREKYVEILPDESKCLHSIEGGCVLTIPKKNGNKIFRVDSLVPLSLLKSDTRYKILTQTFFLDSPPERYVEPLSILAQNNKYTSKQEDCYISCDVLRTPLQAHDAEWSDVENTKEVLLSISSDLRFGLSQLDPIYFDWNENMASFRLVPSKRIVEVCIQIDQSILILKKNGYFQHFDKEGRENIYSPDGLPVAKYSAETNERYEIANLGSHARKMYDLYFGDDEKRMNLKPVDNILPNKKKTNQNKIRVRIQAGEFSLLDDHSVHIIFSDRTILFSNQNYQCCTIISGLDGSETTLNTDNPLQFGKYIWHGKHFYNWATKPIGKRSYRYRSPTEEYGDLLQSIYIRNESLKMTM